MLAVHAGKSCTHTYADVHRHRDNVVHPHLPIYLPSHYQVIFFALLISIPPNFCAGQFVFSPQSKAELKSAVTTCLKFPRDLDCSGGAHGSIGEWDVSRVTDMSDIFVDAASFNSDILKWDVFM